MAYIPDQSGCQVKSSFGSRRPKVNGLMRFEALLLFALMAEAGVYFDLVLLHRAV